MQETDHTENQETPEFSTGDDVGFQRHILPDQVLRRRRQLDSSTAQFLELSRVGPSNSVRLGNGLQGDESIVFAVRF